MALFVYSLSPIQDAHRQGYASGFRLLQEFVFEVAVEGLQVRTASDADIEVVRDAIIQAEAECSVVETEEVVGPAVELSEAVLDHEVQVVLCRGLDGLGVDDMGRLESAGDVGLGLMRRHGVIEHIQQVVILRAEPAGDSERKQYKDDFFDFHCSPF